MKPNYWTYIKSEAWNGRRLGAIRRAGFKCQLCGLIPDKLEDLHVHHNTYDNLGNEPPEDLVCLCEQCHDRHHRYMPSPSQRFNPELYTPKLSAVMMTQSEMRRREKVRLKKRQKRQKWKARRQEKVQERVMLNEVARLDREFSRAVASD